MICNHKKRRGGTCKNEVLPGKTVCKYHTPEKIAELRKRGKNSKRKGYAFERVITNMIKDAFKNRNIDLIVRRNIQSRGGKEAGDVTISNPETLRQMVHIECKHRKQPNLTKAFEQATTEAFVGATPIAITRKLVHAGERQPILVTMDLTNWIEMLCAWIKNEKTYT